MLRNSLMSSSSSFSHLLGLTGAKSTNKAEGDDKKEEDAKKAKAKKAEDDKKEEDAKKAEDEKKEEDAKKAKAKKAEDDKKKEEAEKAEDDDGKKAARVDERARCEAIFLSPHAGGRPDLAAHFAFRTNLSAQDAIAALSVAGAAPAARRGLGDRMTEQANPALGSDPEPTALQPHQRLMAAHAKATGKK